MATEVKLPRLGQGMESGTIVRWLKGEGDPVKKREPLYELDTDKVTQEVEAETDGVLLRIVVAEGEVDVGTTVAVIGNEGEEVAVEAAPVKAPKPPVEAEAPPGEVEAPPGEVEAPPGEVEAPPGEDAGPELEEADAGEAAPEPRAAPEPVRDDGRVKASPLARRIARERGIDLASIAGTGPEGRVVAEDVEQAAKSVPSGTMAEGRLPEGEVEVVQLTSIRKTIARRLTEAWAAPVFQLSVSSDMTEALHLREQLVARLAEGDEKPTVNDVLTKLVAVALTRHRALNATWSQDEIHRHRHGHVGIAVAAPSGLVVPVIRDADRLTVQEIARARAGVVGRARDGKLKLQDLEGGTFTISNLGMFDIERFIAVLNPPQVAILAVGAIKDTPVAVEGELDVAPIMQMTLTCDHRAVDGADGAEFLRTLVALIEQPALAL